MPAAATEKQQRFNAEEFFGAGEATPEELLDQERAAELKKQRAISRRQSEQQEMGAMTKIPTPEQEEAELIEQEYGKPAETFESEEEESDYEEGSSEDEEEESDYEEGPQTGEEEAVRAKQVRQTQMAEQQIRALRTRSLTLNRQIQNANVTIEKKLRPATRALRLSKIADRTKNFAKYVKIFGGIAGSLWYTIIIPLIMVLLIIAVFILWLCGFNLGPPSAKTIELKQKLRTQKQQLVRERDRQVQPMKRELQKINKQINQVSVNITA